MKTLSNAYSGLSGLQLDIPKYLHPPPFENANRLTYYASLFNSIEINSSFYKIPQAVTIAAPYSLRPKPGATVSMPLLWDDEKKRLTISDFTIYNALVRIKSTGDIFKPVIGIGINLEKVIKTFNKE